MTSFFILEQKTMYVNWTGRPDVWKEVHALFPLHVFRSCAFSVSLLKPLNPYQWKPAWPRWISGLSSNQALNSFQSHLCISYASISSPKKAEHLCAGILLFSWGDQLCGHLCWAGRGSHSPFLSDLPPLFSLTLSTVICFLPVTLKLIGWFHFSSWFWSLSQRS